MEELAERIEIVSAERIRDELSKLLCSPAPRRGIELLVETGLAELVVPEVPALRLEIDEHHHHKDVYQHSLTVLDQAIGYERERHPGERPDLVLRLAALLHDIGKPATRRLEPGGAVSFYHHDLVGAKLAKKRLRALRFDNDTVDAVDRLIELHLRFFGYTDGAWTDSAVRRYVRDAGDQLEHLHMLTRADVTTRNRRKADRLGLRLRRSRGAHPPPPGEGGAGCGAPRPRRRTGHAAPRPEAGARGRRGAAVPARASTGRRASRRGGGGATPGRLVGGARAPSTSPPA